MKVTLIETEPVLRVAVSGRIDTLNAEQFGDAIRSIHAAAPERAMILDFQAVEMLTSAGIRELMKFQKSGMDFTLINTCRDVYFSLKLTGLTEILDVSRTVEKLDLDGCEIIGRGATAEVYKLDEETVVKVFTKETDLDTILNERIMAKKAFVAGVPTAISYGLTEVKGKPALVFELINAKSLAKLFGADRANVGRYIDAYVKTAKDIQSIDKSEIDIPLTNETDNFLAELEAISPALTEETYRKLKALAAHYDGATNLLHMDIQPNNLMNTDGGLIVIDMDTLAYGSPVFELGNLYRCLLRYWGFNSDETQIKFLSFDHETAKELWSRYLSAFYPQDSEQQLIEKEKLFRVIGTVYFLKSFYNSEGMTERVRKAFAELESETAELQFV